MLRYSLLLVTLFLLFSCGEEDYKTERFELLEDIPSDIYYNADIFADTLQGLYGSWRLDYTSGGIHGGGYGKDFDYLLMKPNAIFGIVRNDSLIHSGKIEVAEDMHQNLTLKFTAEFNPNGTNVNLVFDHLKFPKLEQDTLALWGGCCDTFNEHFIREK